MAEAVLVARGLGKRFGGASALSGVDLDASPGEILGLIGPNGGGKSTLLLLFAGLLAPDAGSVTVNGVPCVALARAASGQVGLVTSEPGLYPSLTGAENLRFFAGLYGLSADEADARAAPLLSRLDLTAAMARPVGGWSSGMRQKLSLTRALLLRPAVLLLDEPTSNLDPDAAGAMYAALREVAQDGVAVVLCSHDLHAVEALCERVAVIHGGVREVRRLDGPRGAPAPSRLLAAWRGAAP